jgi:hypothetical protein
MHSTLINSNIGHIPPRLDNLFLRLPDQRLDVVLIRIRAQNIHKINPLTEMEAYLNFRSVK